MSFRAARQGYALRTVKPVAEHFSGMKDLKIIQGGMGFWTIKSGVIAIPSVPPGLEKEYEDAILGGTLHEARHLRETDFSVIEEASKDPKYSLTNILEDLRIDKNNEDDYPGGRQINNRLNSFSDKEWREIVKEIEELEAMGAPIEIINRIKPKPLDLLKKAIYDVSCRYPTITDVYGQTILDLAIAVKDLTDKARNLGQGPEHTKTCMKLSAEVFERLKKLLPQNQGLEEDNNEFEEGPLPPDENSKNKKSKNDKSNEDNDKDNKDRNGNTENKKPDLDDEENKQPSSDNENNLKDSNPEMTNTDNPQMSDEEKDLLNMLKENLENGDPGGLIDALNKMIEAKTTTHILKNHRHIPHPDMSKYDYYLHEPPSNITSSFATNYDDLLNSVSPQIGVLQGRIIGLLMSTQLSGWKLDKEDGEINTDDLPFIRHGKRNIYKVKKPRQRINTAVTFLTDISGSMGGDKQNQQKRFLVAASETLEMLHIPYEILAFTTSGNDKQAVIEKATKDGTLNLYNRYQSIVHVTIKDFTERLVDVRWRIMSMHSRACNCDPEAIWWAGERLLMRQEKRKILFVSHDGRPNIYGHTDKDIMENEMFIAIKTLEAAGIEVYGIGIMDECVKKWYEPKKCRVITNNNDIASAMYEPLEEKLMEEKW